MVYYSVYFEDIGDKVKITEFIETRFFSSVITDRITAQESYLYEKEKIKQGIDIRIIDKREHFCMC